MSWRSPITTSLRHRLEDRRAVCRGRRERSAHGIAYYNFWALPPTRQSWFYRFLQRPALRALPRPAGLSVFSVFGRRRLVRMTGGPKLFFTGENLVYYPEYADHLLGEVDLALGFDSLEAENYLRFPLWLTDLFPPEADEAAIQTRLSAFTAAGRDLADRPQHATLLARHDGDGLRGRLSSLLEEFGRVDYPGVFRNNVHPPLEPSYAAKLRFLRDYRFNICPENSDAPGYVTEKVWHAHAAGCIPVYWGSGNRPEPAVLAPEAILFYDPDRPDRLRRRLADLLANPERLVAFGRRERFTQLAAAHIAGYFGRLETALLGVLDG